jgi:hypothetical protein
MGTIRLPDGILAVRAGPGANCSSIGSVVDLLIGTTVLAGVVYVAVATALPDRSPIDVVEPEDDDPTAEEGDR